MLVASCQFRMQYSEMGLRIQRRLDVKPPCYLAGPSGPAFFYILHLSFRRQRGRIRWNIVKPLNLVRRKEHTMEVKPISDVVGAEIIGVNLANSINDETKRVIRDALLEYQVLVNRNQTLTPEQQVIFLKMLI